MIWERVRYFSGQLLSARDFEAEQEYFLQKHRLQNRLLLGSGVVSGLSVSINSSPGASPQVIVSPGVAVDQFGNIIVIDEPAVLSRAGGSTWLVTLRYVEIPKDPVPAPAGTSEGAEEFTRIQESFVFELLAEDACEADAGNAGRLVLARLVRQGERWLVTDSARRAPAGAGLANQQRTAAE